MRLKKGTHRVRHILLITAAVLLAAALFNQIAYAAIVPVIFFHGAYSEPDYVKNLASEVVEEFSIETGNGTLYGWKHEGNSDTVLLYFGGDNTDSNTWVGQTFFGQTSDVWDDVTLLTVDYPLFGKSTGIISEQSFYATAETLYETAREAYPNARLYAMGYSIGTAAALRLACEKPLDGLILIAPMYDGTSLYLPKDSIFHTLFEPTATVQMQNDEMAGRCPVRPLILASETDAMTPIENIYALCARFRNEPNLVLVPAKDHGSYWTCPETYDAITAYLAETKEKEP